MIVSLVKKLSNWYKINPISFYVNYTS